MPAVLILRLAVLFHRSRLSDRQPKLGLKGHGQRFELSVEPGWLSENPLTDAELRNEVDYWREIGISLTLA